MESSMSHLQNHKSLTLFFFEDREWSPHVSHQLSTKLGGQSRRVCERNLVAEQRNDVRSAVGYVQCISQHRVENKPMLY